MPKSYDTATAEFAMTLSTLAYVDENRTATQQQMAGEINASLEQAGYESWRVTWGPALNADRSNLAYAVRDGQTGQLAVSIRDEFVELFNKFDYSDDNPFHRSRAQVKDGVLCRDTADPDHFYLIGEWADIEEHRRIREFVAREIKPEFVQLIEGGHFVRSYAQIVSMTPQEVLDRSQQQ
jgi:hypothetical protein